MHRLYPSTLISSSSSRCSSIADSISESGVRKARAFPSALRWKFLAVYTWSDSEETIRNYYGRDLKRHARTTATADRAHRSSARDARAFDATDEQYSRTGAPGAHRLGRRRRPQQRADRTKARDKPGDGALVAEGVVRCRRASGRRRGGGDTSEKALRKCVEEVLADAPRSGAPATFAPEQVVLPDDEGVLGGWRKAPDPLRSKGGSTKPQDAANGQSSAMLVLASRRRMSEMCEESISRKCYVSLSALSGIPC